MSRELNILGQLIAGQQSGWWQFFAITVLSATIGIVVVVLSFFLPQNSPFGQNPTLVQIAGVLLSSLGGIPLKDCVACGGKIATLRVIQNQWIAISEENPNSDDLVKLREMIWRVLEKGAGSG